MMSRFGILTTYALITIFLHNHAATAQQSARADAASPLGFAPSARAAQIEAEAKALAVPTPQNARQLLRVLTAEPHVAGTPADYRTAVFVRDQLVEAGWKAEIVPYEVLLNYPASKATLALTRPTIKPFDTDETPIATDKDSANSTAFGAFHGYGASGTASGQVVYVNYGRLDDFEAVERMGISIKDKIVLARYGGNFRGLKVLNAQKRGARGILIYSDPADDGYAKGDTYPQGPYRPSSAIQRGSVQFLSLGPGDPSTPNAPSVKGANRLPIDPSQGFPRDLVEIADFDPGISKAWEAKTGLKRNEYYATIPSLPISYDTAKAILTVLAGPNVPSGWQGSLPLAYHVGPGPAEITMSIQMDYKLRDIWNVIATIPGSVEPNHWVMIGNHRDAWVHGAVDPSSGTAATLEMARAIGQAVKSGWKPRRTLLYASWDAEEYGLVGSTEWAEQFAAEIGRNAALMLNVDSAVSGSEFDLAGVPSLRDLAIDAAGAVSDPRTGRTLKETWLEQQRKDWAANSPLALRDPAWDGPTPGGAANAADRWDSAFSPKMSPLGSGSDYTAFLDHLGVPSLDLGFSGKYGVYHSIFDDFTWMEKHGDPEFITHTVAARFFTVLAMRSAAAEVLPFRFGPYAEALRGYVDEMRLMSARRGRAKLAQAGATGPQSDAQADGFPGLPELITSVRGFRARANETDQALNQLAARDGISPEALARINELLVAAERKFLLPNGLPGRPWFRHAVYAPGLSTGYASWPLPLIRQAIEENKPDTTKPLVDQTVGTIQAATTHLEQIANEIRAALKPQP